MHVACIVQLDDHLEGGTSILACFYIYAMNDGFFQRSSVLKTKERAACFTVFEWLHQ
jgi:hypothetical protein